MAFKRITENDMLGKGNVGKPDTPGVSTSEMQRIMDELPREVIAPAFNELSGQLEANTASADIGANAPDGITPDPAPAENSPAKLQSVLQGIVNKITDHIADQVKHVKSEERTLWNNASNDRHTHDNKSILDGITSSLVGNWNAAFAHISDAVRHITENERTNWNDKYTKSETDKAINERVVEIGSSDMTKAVYDPETRNLPYIPKIDAEALTLGKNVVLSGTPVSIAYAGAQRIASITAYGENAQGGTTEAPVALTGVDSVHVCGRNLLPLPYSQVSETKNGLNIAVNADGTITVSGTATAETYLNLKPIPASLYRLMGVTGIVQAYDYPVTKNGFTFFDLTIQPHVEFALVYIVITKGSVVNRTYRPYIIKSAEPLPYETYQGSVTPIPIPRPLRRVGDVRDVCVTRQEYEGTEKLVVTYNVGFVELDGTEASHIFEGMFYLDYSASWPTPANRVNGVCSHYPYGAYGKGKIGLTDNGAAVVYNPNGDYTGDEGGLANWKAYLAAQKEAGTPVQVAYQLAAPEVYATDPVDFDNAAGPLTVMTGGELEVRMTELIGTRSDVSNNTVAFSEAAQDADISSGEKLTVLFGKIKKRFSVVNKLVNGAVYPNLGTNTNFPNPVNQRGATSYTGDGTSPYCIDRWRISNGTTYTVGTFTLSAATYANRACGMWQSNEMGQHQLSIGDDVTVSIYANGKLHTPTMKVIDRDLYDAFANVPASYDCDDFEIVLCTYARDNTMYNLGIYPKKPLNVNYIKWEKGSVATPYVPKAFGDEFLECLRYFVGGVGIGSAGIVSGSTFRVLIPTPVPMRTAPSVTVKVADNVVYNGTFKALNTTVSNITRQRNGIHLHIGMAASGVNNYPGIAYGLQCDLSADL